MAIMQLPRFAAVTVWVCCVQELRHHSHLSLRVWAHCQMGSLRVIYQVLARLAPQILAAVRAGLALGSLVVTAPQLQRY